MRGGHTPPPQKKIFFNITITKLQSTFTSLLPFTNETVVYLEHVKYVECIGLGWCTTSGLCNSPYTTVHMYYPLEEKHSIIILPQPFHQHSETVPLYPIVNSSTYCSC